MNDLRLVLGAAAPYRLALAGCVALMLCESGAALALPWIGGLLAGVLAHGDAASARIGGVLAAMLGVFAALALLRFVSTLVLDGVADRLIADLKVRLYDHLQSLPLAFYHRRRLGDSLALLTTDVYVLGGFISGTAVAAVPLLLTAAGSVAMMFRIRPGLAVLAALAIPVFYLLLKVAGRKLRPLSVALQAEEAGAVAMAQENLGMLPAIKVFTREARESARFGAQIERILSLSARQRWIYAMLGPLVQFLAAAGIVLLIALASADLVAGRLSAAELVSFLLYAYLLTRPVSALADLYGQTQRARGALARLREALAEPPEAPADTGRPAPPFKGEIVFQSVCFGYEGRPRVLDHLDLRIAAGETVALIGPNGAGKSTLSHLLLRLHDPAEGRITIDGVDISTLSLDGLRRQIGVVPQHVLLFHGSVRENIAYGRPEVDIARIKAAARAAQAHDFIAALPQGYETVVGDQGVRLSGGQQQRVALARALLKDPPILILDEATAMFDPQGEAEFLQGARDALRHRTVILITHRQASLAAADRIVEIRDGRVAGDLRPPAATVTGPLAGGA